MRSQSLQALVLAFSSALGAAAVLTDSVYLLRLYTVYAFHTSLGLAVTLLFGVGNQVVICFGAIAGTSAYVAALTQVHAGLSPSVAVPLGLLSGTGLGVALIRLASSWDLRGIRVGILTILASLAFEAVILGNRSVTFGEVGLPVDDPLQSAGLSPIASLRTYAVLGLVLTASASLLLHRVRGGRLWLLLTAAGQDPDLLKANAISPARYMELAAAAASFLAASSGLLYAFSTGYISPSTFTLAESDIPAYLIAAMGGLGSPLGALLGGVVLLALKELTRAVGAASVAVYGLALLLVFSARSRTLRRG